MAAGSVVATQERFAAASQVPLVERASPGSRLNRREQVQRRLEAARQSVLAV